MKEIPMIFRADDVRAILAGRKTQTRRVLKPFPEFRGGNGDRHDPECWGWENFHGEHVPMRAAVKAQPGDRIWVRETWTMIDGGECPDAVAFRADDAAQSDIWRSPIHMPRWASRITLTLTDVRVERLRGISEMDCVREFDFRHSKYPGGAFARTWEMINGKRPGCSWFDNPWVVVYGWEPWEREKN